MKIAEFRIRLIFIFALSIALSSCSKSEDVVDSEIPRVPMVFSNRTPDAVEGDTKTGEKTSSNWSTGDSFGVYASLGTGFRLGYPAWGIGAVWFMTDRVVTATGSGTSATWAYEAIRYWPKDPEKKITFVAYHPNSTTAGSVSTNPTVGSYGFSVDFVANETPAHQEDLLYDVIKNATRLKPNGDSGVGGVGDKTKFTFKHALSKISFSVKTTAIYNGAIISLTSLKIANVKNTGTFTLGRNLDVPKWNNISNPVMHTMYSGILPLDMDESVITNRLLVIPQKGEQVEITANYTIKYNDANDVSVEDTSTASAITAWEIGHHYDYQIAIGLDGITFGKPTSVNWSGTSTEIEVL